MKRTWKVLQRPSLKINATHGWTAAARNVSGKILREILRGMQLKQINLS
jgi:hypothetical protein